MVEQRSDETKEEFAARRLKEAERNNERATRLHEFAAEPKDLYADAVTFHEDRGILRVAFHCRGGCNERRRAGCLDPRGT